MPVFNPSGGIELSLDTWGSLGGHSGGKEASWALIFSACESNTVFGQSAWNVAAVVFQDENTAVYLESVVFILQMFDAQSLCLHLLPEEGRVDHLQ